jgi:tetratricopeptide (TPR) repeat protein
MQHLIYEARAAMEEGRAEDAMKILENSKLDGNREVLFLKGEASYQLQNWGEAINYFRDYRTGNPNDGKAQAYIDMIENILSFYHPDHFNP